MRLDWYSNPEHQKIIRADLYQVTTLLRGDRVIHTLFRDANLKPL
jgi:hypothetical protein